MSGLPQLCRDGQSPAADGCLDPRSHHERGDEIELEIDGHVLDATLELPSQVVTASLQPDQTTTALLEGHGLIQPGGSATIGAVWVLASIPFRHLVLHVEVENLFSVGPVHLIEAVGDLDLTVGRDVSVGLGATVRVDVDSPAGSPSAGGAAGGGWVPAAVVGRWRLAWRRQLRAARG